MESVLRQPELVHEPSLAPARRPKFSRQLLDSEDKFVDPKKEASLILLPEQTTISSQLTLEANFLQKQSSRKKKSAGAFVSIYEYLLSLFEHVKKRIRGSARRRARLTKQGEQALDQLRYLAQLCDATSARTPEQVLEAESAFGEAYYEIMHLSSNLERMQESERAHHVKHYRNHMNKLLRLTD